MKVRHEIQKWLGLADREKTSLPGDIAALRQAADSTVALMSAIDVIDRKPEARLTIAAARISGAHAGRDGCHFESRRLSNWSCLAAARTRIDRSRRSKQTSLPTSRTRLPTSPKRRPELRAVRKSRRRSSGFFEADAFTNPDYVHYALKTTAAAMFCYLLYSLLDWPGIHTCFITCYIVSLGTTAETVEKLTLRILGCLVGAAAGYGAIIFLFPSLTSIGQPDGRRLSRRFAAGYVAAGSPRISYAGFQIAFAFFLCVVQGSAPAFDLTIARDRVIGILIGNLVVYLLFTNLWPVSVGKRIDPAIAALLRRLSAMMRAADTRRAALWRLQAQSQLAEIETNIDLAAYEPAAVRPSATWLAARRYAADEIGALGEPAAVERGQ